jgi:hypothetical protein
MPTLRQLWVNLSTADTLLAGTDAILYLEFGLTGRSIELPDQPGNDLEQPAPLPVAGLPMTSSNATTYIFDVEGLSTADFVPGTVTLRNGNQGPIPGRVGQIGQGWRCHAVLIVGIGEDGKYYPLVGMPDVDRWVAADEPGGLALKLDILKPGEVGVLEGTKLVTK